MVKGVKYSKLVSDLYEGKTQNVPVGKVIVTNTPKHNSEGTAPLTAGTPLNNLELDQFDVFGTTRQNKSLGREESNDVDFKGRDVVNDGLILEGAFDVQNGVINLVRRNGSVLAIDGLLTQADFGIGPTGPAGESGYDGYDGDDGDDGNDGDEGCEGPEGALGEIGPMGKAGEDGPQGIAGPIGQTGLEGQMGPVGPMGRFGHEGARGERGATCEAEPGSPGTEGTPLNTSVVISQSEPDNTAVLWGIPE